MIIFRTSELTHNGRVDIKNNTAISLGSLLLFLQTRTSKKEWVLPDVPREGQAPLWEVTQQR